MRYEATAMGERVTQLYLDPLSASILRRGLRRAVRRRVRNDAPVTDFGFLHLAVATPDFVSLWAGQGLGMSRTMAAGELLDTLTAETDEVLGRLS